MGNREGGETQRPLAMGESTQRVLNPPGTLQPKLTLILEGIPPKKPGRRGIAHQLPSATGSDCMSQGCGQGLAVSASGGSVQRLSYTFSPFPV